VVGGLVQVGRSLTGNFVRVDLVPPVGFEEPEKCGSNKEIKNTHVSTDYLSVRHHLRPPTPAPSRLVKELVRRPRVGPRRADEIFALVKQAWLRKGIRTMKGLALATLMLAARSSPITCGRIPTSICSSRRRPVRSCTLNAGRRGSFLILRRTGRRLGDAP